jgi:4-nitrophenyl phosphatase/NagD protein
MVQNLHNIRLFLLDMDGTFYIGDHLISGALEFMKYLTNHNTDYLFITNNSSKNATLYENKIRLMGFNIPDGKVFTSGEATAIYIKKLYAGKKVFLTGTDALKNEFLQAGIELTEQDPQAVVLGFDTSISYQKIWMICDFIRAGLPYIATHPDLNCPTETGYMPDTGSFIALIKASTGREPDAIIGKPNPYMIELVISKTGIGIDQIAIVGDRLYTDIALGRTGITTILTLSGESKETDITSSPHQPDYVVRDLQDLLDLLKKKSG